MTTDPHANCSCLELLIDPLTGVRTCCNCGSVYSIPKSISSRFVPFVINVGDFELSDGLLTAQSVALNFWKFNFLYDSGSVFRVRRTDFGYRLEGKAMEVTNERVVGELSESA